MSPGDANEDIERLRAEVAGLRSELAAARSEMTAACVGEARALDALADQISELTELQALAEQALADQRLLADIQRSRAYRTITLYRRAVNRVRTRRSR